LAEIALLLQGHSTNCTGELTQVETQGAEEKYKQQKLLLFIPYQFCNLVHYRCTAVWQSRKKELGQKGAS